MGAVSKFVVFCHGLELSPLAGFPLLLGPLLLASRPAPRTDRWDWQAFDAAIQRSLRPDTLHGRHALRWHARQLGARTCAAERDAEVDDQVAGTLADHACNIVHMGLHERIAIAGKRLAIILGLLVIVGATSAQGEK